MHQPAPRISPGLLRAVGVLLLAMLLLLVRLNP